MSAQGKCERKTLCRLGQAYRFPVIISPNLSPLEFLRDVFHIIHNLLLVIFLRDFPHALLRLPFRSPPPTLFSDVNSRLRLLIPSSNANTRLPRWSSSS